MGVSGETLTSFYERQGIELRLECERLKGLGLGQCRGQTSPEVEDEVVLTLWETPLPNLVGTRDEGWN